MKIILIKPPLEPLISNSVRFIAPGSLMGLLSSKKLASADDVADDAQLLGRPRYLTTRRKSDSVSDSDPPLRPEGLAKKGDARF